MKSTPKLKMIKETITQSKEKFQGQIKKFSKTPQGHSFAWVSLTVFTVSFFLVVAIRPTILTIAKLSREIKEKELADKQLDEKIKSLVEAQKIYAQYSQKIAMLDEALPQRSQFPAFAYFLEQVGDSLQITLDSLSFGKIEIIGKPAAVQNKDNVPYSKISFSVSTSGNYQNLKTFMETLENYRRLINIEATNFSEIKQKEESSPGQTLSLILSGSAYFEKELK